jgi:hypothetical protein
MKRYALSGVTSICLLLQPAGSGIAQTVGDQAPPPRPAAASPPDGVQFGFDDLMSMLIQPRHEKLFSAGTQKNWELAALESRNLRAAFAHAAQVMPRYLGQDVAQATATIMTPKLDAIDAAIAAADPRKFAKAFSEVTEACNACHTYLERPYILIKVPDGPSAYPDQEFKAPN